MIRLLKQIFKINKPQIRPLGRWSKPATQTQEDIKVLLANYDCCGDHLCGNPKTLKKDIDIIYKNNI